MSMDKLFIPTPTPSQLSWWTLLSNNWYQSIRSLKDNLNNFGRSMVNLFRKDIPRFDWANYDNWKEKMKTRMFFMGPGYWILTKGKKKIVEESKLEDCSEEERDMFMCNMEAREALL